MFNKSVLLAVCLVTLAPLVSGQIIKDGASKEEVIRLIPASDDLLDLRERENLRELIESVDSIYPILCEELLSRNDSITPGNIIGILSKTKTNKEPVRASIRQFMELHRTNEVHSYRGIPAGITALGKIGSPEDVEFLSGFLDSGRDLNRVLARKAIDEIQSRAAAEERDAARLKRSGKREGGSRSDGIGSNDNHRTASKVSSAIEDEKNPRVFWIWTLGCLVLMVLILLFRLCWRKNLKLG